MANKINDKSVVPMRVVAPSQQEPLQARWAEFKRLEAEWLKATAIQDGAQNSARSEYPERSIDLFGRHHKVRWDGTDRVEIFPLTAEQIIARCDLSRLVSGAKSKAALSNQRRLRDLRRWEAACRDVDAAYGVPSLAAATGDAERAMNAAEERFLRTPALTPLDILLMLQFADEAEGCSANPNKSILSRVVVGLIGDLKKTTHA